MSHESDAEPPFAGHRRYYLFLKIAVLVVAALLALRYLAPYVLG
jgi:hypothetical protein